LHCLIFNLPYSLHLNLSFARLLASSIRDRRRFRIIRDERFHNLLKFHFRSFSSFLLKIFISSFFLSNKSVRFMQRGLSIVISQARVRPPAFNNISTISASPVALARINAVEFPDVVLAFTSHSYFFSSNNFTHSEWPFLDA